MSGLLSMKKKRNKTKILLIIISSLLIIIGIYFLILYFSPKLKGFYSKNSNITFSEKQNYIKVSSQNINTLITEGGEEQLDKGAWHRFPDKGNPEIGGNFILSAHSFVWGKTPGEVIEKSFFYNLKDVKEGDEVLVHWNSKDYKYKVEKVFQVKPTQTEIEDASGEAKLTIYTCTEKGSADGRVVVVAKPTT